MQFAYKLAVRWQYCIVKRRTFIWTVNEHVLVQASGSTTAGEAKGFASVRREAAFHYIPCFSITSALRMQAFNLPQLQLIFSEWAFLEV